MSKKPNLSAVKSAMHKDKFKHGSMAVVFTAVFISIIIVVNILVSALSDRFPSMNFDMTLEGLNTLSEEAVDVAKGIESDTTIYIIGSEDAVRGDEVYTNYGLQYSQVANLADRLQELNSKIKVEFIDPDRNPTFISQYPDDNLTTGKVMISSEKRNKVLSVTDLFSIQQDSTPGEYTYYSKVDGALANALYLVNLDTVPVVALATGHDEMLDEEQNLSSFTALLEDNNFEVKTFNILQEEIPEDASMVFIGTPTTDYTTEEIKKLEAFISDEEMASSRTLFFTTYPTLSWDSMPNLSTFLEEWGLKPQSSVLMETDAGNVLTTGDGSASPYLFANVSDDVMSDTYENVVMPFSAPVERLFSANNDIVTYSVVETSDTAYAVSADSDGTEENPETGTHTIVALSQKYMDNQGKITANIVVDGSSESLLSTFIANSTFGNKAFTTDFVKLLTGTSDTRIGISVSQTQTNTRDIAASASVIQFVGLIVFTALVPIAVLAAGLVIFLRRRHL